MASAINWHAAVVQIFCLLQLAKKPGTEEPQQNSAMRETLQTAGYCLFCMVMVAAAPFVALLMLALGIYKSIHDTITVSSESNIHW